MEIVKRIPISIGTREVRHPVVTELQKRSYWENLMRGDASDFFKSTDYINIGACGVSIDPATGESEVCPHGIQYFWSDENESS